MSDEAQQTPEVTTERDDGPTLGSRLRAARETRELAIEKIADELRIEEHVLVALEEDRLADIKVAPVFVKGYIKQYGRLLHLDYDELRQAFYAQIDTEDVSLRPNSSIQLRDERQITVWIIAALAALLVGVALLVWWLGTDEVSVSGLLGDSATTQPVPATPQSTDGTRLPGAATGPARSDSAETLEVTSVTAPITQAAGGAPPGEPTTPAGSDAVDDGGAGAAPGAPGAPAAEITTVAVAEPLPGSIPMLFEFSSESWLELHDANGQRLYYDLAGAGSRLSFNALPPVRVLIGNAAAASITVDSEAFAIPSGSLRGNVASFLIAPAQD